ncbi:MAG TPA: hypothetical protein VN733_00160 [Solirubrobacterales bacterium]|nr:hypothetical protein [Solirubrobacterales bacterium]
MLRLRPDEHAGSRPQAQDLASQLPGDLAGQTVVLDCGHVLVATPSFLDEIVKQVLEIRNAALLEVVDASQRARDLLSRSVANRGISTSRLKIAAGVH